MGSPGAYWTGDRLGGASSLAEATLYVPIDEAIGRLHEKGDSMAKAAARRSYLAHGRRRFGATPSCRWPIAANSSIECEMPMLRPSSSTGR